MNKKLICLFFSATISTVFCSSKKDPHNSPRNDSTENGATKNLQSNKPKVSLKKFRPTTRKVDSENDSSTGQTTKQYLLLGSSPLTQTMTNVRKKKDDDLRKAISPVAQSQMNIQFLSRDPKHPTLFKSLDGNMTANICIQNKIIMIQINSRSLFDSTKGQELREYIQEKNINNYPVSIVFSGKQIGQWAFNNWSSLQRVVVQDSDVNIAKQAFVRNPSLNSIYLPKSFYGKFQNDKGQTLKHLGIDQEGKNWELFDKGKSIQLKKDIEVLTAEQNFKAASSSRKTPIVSKDKEFSQQETVNSEKLSILPQDKTSFQKETVKPGVEGTVTVKRPGLCGTGTKMFVQEYINQEYINSKQGNSWIEIDISGTPHDVFEQFFYPLAQKGRINQLWQKEANQKIRFTDHIDTLFHGIPVLTLVKIGQKIYSMTHEGGFPNVDRNKRPMHGLLSKENALQILQEVKNDFPELQKLSETEFSDIALVLASFPVAYLQQLPQWIVEMPCLSQWTDTIPEAAFRTCKLKKFPEIPENIHSIGPWTFAESVYVDTVNIPGHVINVEDFAFYDSNLSTAIINAEDCELGNGLFGNATNLNCIHLPGHLRVLNTGTFAGCDTLESTCDQKGREDQGGSLFNIPPHVQVIGSRCFYNCKSLKNISIPNVQYIGPSAFSGCEGMNIVGNKLPENLCEICDSAFSGCRKVVLTELPKNVKLINKSAFKNCFKIEITELPQNLTVIYDSALSGCINNDIKIIPQNVQYIGNRAFSHNFGMTEITFPSTMTFVAGNGQSPVKVLRPVKLDRNGNKDNEFGRLQIDETGKLKLEEVSVPINQGLGRNVFDQNIALHKITMSEELFSNIAGKKLDRNEQNFETFLQSSKLSQAECQKIRVLLYLGLLHPLDIEAIFNIIQYNIIKDSTYENGGFGYYEDSLESFVDNMKNKLKIALFENDVFEDVEGSSNFSERVEKEKEKLQSIMTSNDDNAFNQMQVDLASRWKLVVNPGGTVTLTHPVRKAIVEKMKQKEKEIRQQLTESKKSEDDINEKINQIWLSPEEISEIRCQ